MICIYARQSIDKKDSLSIEDQIQRCRALCADTTEQIETFQDKGFSGSNINRPAFQRMMSLVKTGVVSTIIVYKNDKALSMF